MNNADILIYADGTKSWWINGKCHREDGPAVEWADGTKEWYLNGEFHRLDGPAYHGPDTIILWSIFDRYINYIDDLIKLMR